MKRSREDFDSPTASPSASSYSNSRPDSRVSGSPDAYDSVKIAHLEIESGEASKVEVMRCSLPPHRESVSFATFEDYDVHYNKIHVNRCVECRRNFPTPHFLNLHQEEFHDPLAEVLRERGERTYSCFVEDCDRKCSTPQKRRMHLIDKHMFPKDYDFYVVKDGIDQRSSMLRSGRHRRKSSAAQHKADIDDRTRRRQSTLGKANSKELDGDNVDNEMDETLQVADINSSNTPVSPGHTKDHDMEDLSGAMSALKFIPTSVRFGRGRGRGGFSKT